MRRIARLSALITLLVLLGLSQLVLPGIAANRLRSRLSRYGEVQSVHVSAFPAIQLLWHHADSVRIAMRSYRSASTQMGSLLAQAGDADTIDVTAGQVEVGLLRLHDAALHKRGKQLAASARVSESDLRRSLPRRRPAT